MRFIAIVVLLFTLSIQSISQSTNQWQTGPLHSYTFSQSSSQYGWNAQLEEKYGVATLNGVNQYIDLSTFQDDYGSLLNGQTIEQSIELSLQLLEYETSTVFEFGSDSQSIKLRVSQAVNSLNTWVATLSTGTTTSQVQCYGCATGSWAHIVLTLQSNSQTTNDGVLNLYVNGQLVASSLAQLFALADSQSLLGRSITPAVNENFLNANLDKFYVYNYALSNESIKAHTVMEVSPVFELEFAIDPRIRAGLSDVTANYQWERNSVNQPDGPGRPTPGVPSEPTFELVDYHRGSLIVISPNMYVNLSSLTGTSSVATVLPMTGGGRGVGARPANRGGWSLETVFRLNSPMASPIFDWAVSSDDASNSILLSLTPDSEIVFTVNNPSFPASGESVVCIDWETYQPGTWYHLVISISSTGFAQCFVDGKLTAYMESFPLPALVDRQSSLIGRRNSGTQPMFQTLAIDVIRVHQSALSSDLVEALCDVYSPAAPADDKFDYQSGPVVQYYFDEPRQLNDQSNSLVDNQYGWHAVGAGSAAADTVIRSNVFGQSIDQPVDLTVKHNGLTYIDQSIDQSTTEASNQYVNLNFDSDSRGATLPLYLGPSMSFEMWVLIDRWIDSVTAVSIFDLADSSNNVLTNRLTLSVDAMGQLTFQWMTSDQSANQIISPAQSFQSFEWTHVAVSIDSINQPNTQSNFTIYVNGVVVANAFGVPVDRSMRRLAMLGRSISATNNQPNNQFIGYFDSFLVYNHALTSNQIGLHLSINQPSFDCSFDQNPMLLGFDDPTYTYIDQAVNQSTIRRGVLSFDGSNQYVDLTANFGPSSVGFPLPIIGPITQSTYQSSNQASTFRAFSIETSFNVQSLNDEKVAVFEFSNNGPVHMISMPIIDGSLFLSISHSTSESIDFLIVSNVQWNVWYHIAVTMQSIDQTNNGQYSIYLNGELINQTISQLPQSIKRHYAALAKGSFATESIPSPIPWIPSPPSQFFNGLIDVLRVYETSLSSQQVLALAQRQNWAVERSFRVDAPLSSSSTALDVPTAVSSSAALSSSAVSSSAQSSSAQSSSAVSSSAESSSVVSSSVVSSSSPVVSSSVMPSSSPVISSSAAVSSSTPSSSSTLSSTAASISSSVAESSSPLESSSVAESSSPMESSSIAATSSPVESSSSVAETPSPVESSTIAATSSPVESSSVAATSSPVESSSVAATSSPLVSSSVVQSSSPVSSSMAVSSSATPSSSTAQSSSSIASSSSAALSSSAQSSSPAQSSSAAGVSSSMVDTLSSAAVSSSASQSSTASQSSSTPSSTATFSSSSSPQVASSASVSQSSSAQSSSIAAVSSSPSTTSVPSSSSPSSAAVSSSVVSSSGAAAVSSSVASVSSSTQSTDQSSSVVPTVSSSGATSSFRSSSSVFTALSSSIRAASSSSSTQAGASSSSQVASSSSNPVIGSSSSTQAGDSSISQVASSSSNPVIGSSSSIQAGVSSSSQVAGSSSNPVIGSSSTHSSTNSPSLSSSPVNAQSSSQSIVSSSSVNPTNPPSVTSSSSQPSAGQSSSSVNQPSDSSSSSSGSAVIIDDNSSSSSSLSAGSLAAAIVVPVVVGLCLLITALLFFCKRSKTPVGAGKHENGAEPKPIDGQSGQPQVNYGYSYGNGVDTTLDGDDTTVQVVELERMPVE